MISFSGIDCSGKSTQIEKLCVFLDEKHIKYQVIWSRGGYTPGIEFLKGLVRGKRKKNNALSEESRNSETPNGSTSKVLFVVGMIDLFLYYSVVLRIKQILGIYVICDRYLWDTFIDYKMKYKNVDFDKWLLWKMVEKFSLKPEKSFIFYISPEESARRSELKNEPFPESIEKRKERYDNYKELIDRNKWENVINTENDIEIIFNQIKEVLDFE